MTVRQAVEQYLAERNVHVRRGQTLIIHAGAGVELSITKFGSGAVVLRNRKTGHVLASWAPKDARSSR